MNKHFCDLLCLSIAALCMPVFADTYNCRPATGGYFSERYIPLECKNSEVRHMSDGGAEIEVIPPKGTSISLKPVEKDELEVLSNEALDRLRYGGDEVLQDRYPSVQSVEAERKRARAKTVELLKDARVALDFLDVRKKQLDRSVNGFYSPPYKLPPEIDAQYMAIEAEIESTMNLCVNQEIDLRKIDINYAQIRARVEEIERLAQRRKDARDHELALDPLPPSLH